MNNGKNTNAARALAMGVAAALFIVSLQGTGAALSNSGGGSWQYYKEITISNSGGALSDYQVLVQLSSSNFPTNARSDGADVRFTDASGGIELSYWIESWDYSGRSAKIWVKVPSIPAGEITTIHMYNGNPSAGSASSGDATFEFFDDFDDNSRNGWNAIFDSDVFTEQTQRMEYSVGWNGMTQRNHILVANKVFSNFNFIIDFYSQTLGSGNYRSNGWAIYNSPSSFGAYVNYGDSGGGSFCGNDGCSISPSFGMTSQQTIGNCGNSNKHSISVRYNGSYLSVLCGNGAIPNVQIASFKGTLPSSYQFGLNGDEGGGGTTENHAYWDNFRVRKYASSEPTLTLGAEQATSTPTPTTPAPTTPAPTTPAPTTPLPTTPIPTTPTTASSLSVSSIPSGATIYLDGDNKKETPYTITNVAPGYHLVELKLSGYKDWKETIDVKAGSTSYVSVPLASLSTSTATTTPTYTATPTPTPSKPSVSLHGDKTDVVLGEDIILKLSALNLITKPKMHVQVIIIPPSGMSVTSSEFSKVMAGQFAANYELEPGEGKDIEVRIKSNQAGQFNVDGRVVYYFGDDKDTGGDSALSLPIKVREVASVQNPIASPVQKSTSGFGALIGIIGLLFITLLKKRRS